MPSGGVGPLKEATGGPRMSEGLHVVNERRSSNINRNAARALASAFLNARVSGGGAL